MSMTRDAKLIPKRYILTFTALDAPLSPLSIQKSQPASSKNPMLRSKNMAAISECLMKNVKKELPPLMFSDRPMRIPENSDAPRCLNNLLRMLNSVVTPTRKRRQSSVMFSEEQDTVKCCYALIGVLRPGSFMTRRCSFEPKWPTSSLLLVYFRSTGMQQGLLNLRIPYAHSPNPVDWEYGQLKPRRIFAKEFAVFLCSVSLMMSIGQGQIVVSKTMPSSGFIDDPSRTAVLLLQSSFDTASVIGSNSEPAITLYDVNGRGVSNYADLTPKDNTDGSRIWIEDGTLCTPHSGIKCVGFRSSNALSYGVRSCLMLTHLDGSSGYPNSWKGLAITGDFYLSVWLFFPANWSIPTSDPVEHYSPNWCEMMNLFELSDTDAVNPKLDIHIHRRTGGSYFLELQYERANGVDEITWNMINPFDISTILGKWTKWAYFIHRSIDTAQAYVQVWLNDNLLGTFNDQNGSPSYTSRSYHFYTMNRNGNNTWLTIFAKTYLDGDGINYHYLWADDLEVWDGIP